MLFSHVQAESRMLEFFRTFKSSDELTWEFSKFKSSSFNDNGELETLSLLTQFNSFKEYEDETIGLSWHSLFDELEESFDLFKTSKFSTWNDVKWNVTKAN